MDRVLSSPSKQKALVRLMSSDPSLLNALDDDLLASITLQSEPRKTNAARQPTRLTNKANAVAARKNIQLYPEDAAFAERKKAMMPTLGISNTKRVSLVRANTVLLSPSSNATAVAASASSRQDTRKCAGFSMNSSARANAPRSTFSTSTTQQKAPPMVLLDANMLELVDGGTNTTSPQRNATRSGSTKKKAKRMRRREKQKGSTSGSSTNNSEDETGRHHFTGGFDIGHLIASAMTNDSASLASDSDDGVPSTSPNTSSVASRFLLDHHHFVARDQWIPPRSRKACFVCMREFNLIRKRHSCRMCGEVICRRCSVFREVNLPVLENKFRICSCCFVSYRKKREEAEQNQLENEADATDSASDGSVDRPEATAARGGSLASADLTPELPATEAAPSLSPSDSTSDHSSSRNTINTMSDFSFSFDTLYEMSAYSGSFSGSRNMEEELEAVLKAKQLEKEVEASQQRIRTLEAQISTQESQQDLLSTEQQLQLQEARATINLLQEQLRMQELNARQAAHNRDSICLSKLRQTELYATEDDESQALKKKLKVLERQLKQAGISVAEVIPYEVAKRKVEEISKRLQEIGASEVVMEDKQAQAAARKEYYILEQEMEKYHMALVMTDEYIEEQRRQEQEWEDANRAANLEALRLLRSAIPVDISRLSEKDLIGLLTPTGVKFPAELARRLKRTNVLQLLRVDPKSIVKMHPSVIEGYRCTGLTLLERRALHAVLQEPFKDWKRQQKDEMAQKKYAWCCKLKEAFVVAATNFQNHCAVFGAGEDGNSQHQCTLLGLSCPARAEDKMRKLYCGLGFTPDAEFIQEDILKSDPEGAGEKALLEAQGHAREMVANQRQRELKTHYKMNMRDVAQAVGALEEMDSILSEVRALDESFLCSAVVNSTQEREQLSQCNLLLTSARELMLLLAKRAGICMTGKRNPAKDEEDTRSPVEIREAGRAIAFLQDVLADVKLLLFNEEGTLRENKSVTAAAAFKAVQELLDDVREKNLTAMDGQSSVASDLKRVPWMERAVYEDSHEAVAPSEDSSSLSSFVREEKPAALPTSASLFDAIKARRKQNRSRAGSKDSNVDSKPVQLAAKSAQSNKPMDLMAAIRSRRRVQSNAVVDADAAKSA